MTDKKTEALKLALEALRDCRRSDDDRVSVAMGILQEALAEQPAQQRHISYVCPQCHWSLDKQPAQRTWVGLTDEEFQMIYDIGRTPAGMMELVEAKLKEKNT